MKIAVTNYSGNTGKTTTSRHLLAPRIKSEIISVESVNSDGQESNEVLGNEFTDLIQQVNLVNSIVVDVGGSNAKEFFHFMRQQRGSHEDFDFFCVPVTPQRKQIIDAIKTIDTLSNIGVAPKNIRVVFNMIECDQKPTKLFSDIFDHLDAKKSFVINKSYISSNEIYSMLNRKSQSIDSVLADKTDLKKQLSEETDINKKMDITDLISLRRMAISAKEELDVVFSDLVGKK